MQTSSGWTRDNHNNEYLYNAGSELNASTGWYEMFYWGYDPALGRMLQVDPMASKYASLTPYNYSFNDPVYWNDPSGADPTPDQIWNYLLRLLGSMESGQYVRISAEQLHMHITGDSGGGGLGGGYGVDIQTIVAHDAVSHSDGSISLRLYFVSSNTSRADIHNGDNIMGRVMMDYTEIKIQQQDQGPLTYIEVLHGSPRLDVFRETTYYPSPSSVIIETNTVYVEYAANGRISSFNGYRTIQKVTILENKAYWGEKDFVQLRVSKGMKNFMYEIENSLYHWFGCHTTGIDKWWDFIRSTNEERKNKLNNGAPHR
ncbi:MAG: hypothetical protein KF845_07565 [Cyclobacteriaceae bacterium]|nr:hypothetical protein [Cyclobacteriaceae bacterium]